MRRAFLFLLTLCIGIALAGCGSSHSSAPGTITATTMPSSSSSSSVPSSASVLSTATTSNPSSPAPASTSPTTSKVGVCATSELTASLGEANGTAGTTFYQLAFTNSGTVTCTLQGYPGVSFVTGSTGQQVGAAAARETGPAPVVTLAPGQSASATLGIVDAANYGTTCQPTSVLGLRVYPPDDTAALFVSHTDTGCANSADVVLNIRPLQS